jgi:hypothetical protein
VKDIHVPLPDPAYAALSDRRREARAASIARYAAENGGTEVDLDAVLEAASIESLLGANE